jgi:hypothetical protein
LIEPVGEVVVIGDSTDLALGDFKKCSDAKVVGLTGGRWETFVGGQVGAADEEFGCGMVTVRVAHDGEVLDLLGVAAIHPVQELAEGVQADLTLALIDVMDYGGVKKFEEGVAVAGVEGGVVELDEFAGVGSGARFGHGASIG